MVICHLWQYHLFTATTKIARMETDHTSISIWLCPSRGRFACFCDNMVYMERGRLSWQPTLRIPNQAVSIQVRHLLLTIYGSDGDVGTHVVHKKVKTCYVLSSQNLSPKGEMWLQANLTLTSSCGIHEIYKVRWNELSRSIEGYDKKNIYLQNHSATRSFFLVLDLVLNEGFALLFPFFISASIVHCVCCQWGTVIYVFPMDYG